MHYTIKEVTFDDILPVWEKKLWPNRQSPIRAMSSMTYDSKYDMCIYQNYTASFWAVYYNNEIVAVNSGHQTSADDYRSRGLYTSTDHRGKGLARMVLTATIACAKASGCKRIWTLPRKASMPAYESVGFTRCSDWFDEAMEFGPNCLAVIEF